VSLVLKLGPRERVIINGVVMENGDRRTRLQIITPDAKVLRLRDAIHPDEVTTPVRRVCYVAQLVLAGEADPEEGGASSCAGSSSSPRSSATPTRAPG
jgi:flagellar biosynthesis repressor protein FlbT